MSWSHTTHTSYMVATAGGFGPPPPVVSSKLTAKPTSSWAVNKAKRSSESVQEKALRLTPGPGSYAWEKTLSTGVVPGGRLSSSEARSMVDEIMGERIHNPGPDA